jgi:hypothetical protein
LPGKPGNPGRHGGNNRLFIEAVLFAREAVLFAQIETAWRDLPDKFGNWFPGDTFGKFFYRPKTFRRIPL